MTEKIKTFFLSYKICNGLAYVFINYSEESIIYALKDYLCMEIVYYLSPNTEVNDYI